MKTESALWGINEAIDRAAGQMQQAVSMATKEFMRGQPPRRVYPVPRPVQVQRFLRHDVNSLTHLYNRYGPEEFDRYVRTMLSYLEGGL